MVAEGMHRGAVTETGWIFAFVRASGERRELNHSSQEGAFAFPVPASWEHDKNVSIFIGIPGDNPGYLRLQNLRLQPASDVLPSAPQPVSPEDGQEVTPPAADFLWSAPRAGQVSGYDLEWQCGDEKNQTAHIAAYFLSDAQGAWPTHWLSPGQYSWKVRALNPSGKSGPWSKVMHFIVRPEVARQAPDVIPNPKHPLFLVDLETNDPGSAWKLLPADVRSHLAIRMGGSLEQIQHTLEQAQKEGIPIALQVNGPHDIIAGRWDRVPLARLAQWAHQYSELKAFYICEQEVQGGIENPAVKSYLERLIDLGSEVGRPVCWADANWGGNIWLDVVADKDFMRFLNTHYGYLYPLWKMNGGFEPYLAPAGLLGLWLTRTVAAWGVQAESWYWTEAGFTTLGVQSRYKEGVQADAPPVIFQELALLGASAGAEIYSFEPGTDFFGPDSHQNLNTILIPLIRMLAGSVIPNRHEVQTAVTQQRILEPADLVFRNHYTDSMHQFFSHTLGITYPYEMVPESGNCYWIPFVPKAAAMAARHHQADSPSATPGSCSPPIAGDAAVFKVGKTDVIFNSRVNWSEEESFSLRLAGAVMSGKLGVNGWVVVFRENTEEARLCFFARPDARLVLEFNRPVAWQTLIGFGDQSGVTTPQYEYSLLKSSARLEATQHIELRAERRPLEILIRQPPAVSR